MRRELEEFSIGSIRYPYLPVVGDRELIIEAVRLLIPLVPAEAEVLLAPEFGGAVVAHQLSVETGLPYIVARKRMPPVFGSGIAIPVRSAAADQDGCLYLAERDARALRGRAALRVHSRKEGIQVRRPERLDRVSEWLWSTATPE